MLHIVQFHILLCFTVDMNLSVSVSAVFLELLPWLTSLIIFQPRVTVYSFLFPVLVTMDSVCVQLAKSSLRDNVSVSLAIVALLFA